MQWIPKPYQERAVSLQLRQSHVGLFLDPGMGKTAICLAAFSILQEKGYVDKMIIVSPIRPMYGTWPAEIEKWDDFRHLSVGILHGPRKEAVLQEDHDVYIVNPEGVEWFFGRPAYMKYDKETKKKKKIPARPGAMLAMPHLPEVLCIDESTKFKNAGSIRSKCINKQRHKFDRRWLLTGTPSPNGIEDLFGQLLLLDGGAALGTFITHFRREYMYPSEDGYGWEPRRTAFRDVSDAISPLILQLSAADHLELPEFVPVYRTITLEPEVYAQYKEMEKELFIELDTGEIEAANSAGSGAKCRQICNGAVYDAEGEVHVVHDEKLDELEDLVEEIGAHPILLVYEFQHDKDRIQQRLGKLPNITGATGKALERLQEQFNAGKIPILLAHAGSTHGLNIQEACSHMIFFCTTWNLEYYIQTIDRLVRQGNRAKLVLCYFLVAAKTIDEKVIRRLGEKGAEQTTLREMIDEYRR